MRLFDRSNIDQIFLSPYVNFVIHDGGLLLEHRLSGASVFMMPKDCSLHALWTGIHDGGNEAFWRTMLQNIAERDTINLEYLIFHGYVE